MNQSNGRQLRSVGQSSSGLFQPDLLLADQLTAVRGMAASEGERQLMVAVLEDAAHCYQKYLVWTELWSIGDWPDEHFPAVQPAFRPAIATHAVGVNAPEVGMDRFRWIAMFLDLWHHSLSNPAPLTAPTGSPPVYGHGERHIHCEITADGRRDFVDLPE